MPVRTIAIDIDDVLAANAAAFVAYGNKKWGTQLTVEDYDEHWGKMWQVDLKTLRQFSDEYHASEVIGSYDHYEEAVAVLQTLSQRYRLVILTSRRKLVQQDTLDWIARYFPDIFDEVRFAGFYDDGIGLHLTKADLAVELGASYLIDDQLKHCLATAEAGVTALLFGNYSWNKTDAALPHNVVRVSDWAAVERFFDGRHET